MRDALRDWCAWGAYLLRLGLACLLLGFTTLSAAADANELRAKYVELREQLRESHFHRPLHVDSSESANNLRGDVYAVLDHSFAEVGSAMRRPADWCDILILPFNTKYCSAAEASDGAVLRMRIARRPDQPVQEAYRLDFVWRTVAEVADYLEIRLDCSSGPLGTRDYRITMSAMPLDAHRVFMHLSYSYSYSLPGRLAMRTYLATSGANKIGFTATGRNDHGQPIYVGGLRGIIERNVMRYFLAIDAHLASLRVPADQQLEKRIETWFDQTERYPRQLHEMDRSSYLAMKRAEAQRQQLMAE